MATRNWTFKRRLLAAIRRHMAMCPHEEEAMLESIHRVVMLELSRNYRPRRISQ